MNDECTVTFEGDQGGTYYVACNLTEYISDSMVNTGSSTITLYPQIQQGQNQTNITIPGLSYPRYSVTGGYRYITNARNIRFNFASNYYREHSLSSFVLMVVICSVALIKLVSRR